MSKIYSRQPKDLTLEELKQEINILLLSLQDGLIDPEDFASLIWELVQ